MSETPHDDLDNEDIPFYSEEDDLLAELEAEHYRGDQLEQEVRDLELQIAELTAEDLARIQRLTKLEKWMRHLLRDIRKEIMEY